MRTFACVVIAVILMSFPALAQEDLGDLTTGYRLGKFHATASMLAHELTMIVALVEETGLADISEGYYTEGEIDDADLETANMVLAYSIWRCQFMVLPVCDGGLSSESFDHPALDAYKDPTMEILTGVKVSAEEFMEVVDLDALLYFSAEVQEGAYIEDLLLLAEMAASDAGEL